MYCGTKWKELFHKYWRGSRQAECWKKVKTTPSDDSDKEDCTSRNFNLLSLLLNTRTSSIMHLQYATERRNPGGKQAVHTLFYCFLFCLWIDDDDDDHCCTFELWGLTLCHPSIPLNHSSLTAITLGNQNSHIGQLVFWLAIWQVFGLSLS